MSRANDERNRASLDRLRAIGSALSDEDLLRVIDPPWSASALFAHMAFYDRFALARWQHAVETGSDLPLAIDDAPLEMLNVAALPQWGLVPPRAAVEECLVAGEAVNRHLASLSDEAVAAIVAEGRERLVDRSIHRGEHLATIEAAFPAG